MANKLFSFFKQGSDNYEVKDAQARTNITQLNNDLSNVNTALNTKQNKAWTQINQSTDLSNYHELFITVSTNYGKLTNYIALDSVASVESTYIFGDTHDNVTFKLSRSGYSDVGAQSYAVFAR